MLSDRLRTADREQRQLSRSARLVQKPRYRLVGSVREKLRWRRCRDDAVSYTRQTNKDNGAAIYWGTVKLYAALVFCYFVWIARLRVHLPTTHTINFGAESREDHANVISFIGPSLAVWATTVSRIFLFFTISKSDARTFHRPLYNILLPIKISSS